MDLLWGRVKDNFQTLARITQTETTTKEGLDMNYITPTLMALGKVSDDRATDFLRDLQGNTALIWNTSDKDFSCALQAELNNLVLDAPWTTPAQFSQVIHPSISTIF